MTIPNPYNCAIPSVDSAKSKEVFSADELSDVQKRLDLTLRRLQATTQPEGTINRTLSNRVKSAVQKRIVDSTKLTNVIALNPRTGRNFQHLLALDWGVMKRQLGLGDDLTESGDVLNRLLTARRSGRGSMHHIIAQSEMVGRNIDAYNAILPLKKKYNINRNDFDDITTKAVEIGWHPYIQTDMKIGPEGLRILQEEQNNFFKQLRDLGMSDEDISLLGRQASSVADTYMETLQIARDVGINVSSVEGINYFPRLFSDEAIKRFEWKQVSDHRYDVNGSIVTPSSAFVKGRNTFNFVVEDEILLDYVLRHANPNIYNDLGVASVRELFDDNRKLGDALFNHLSEGQLDRFVDSGLLSKLPMNSTEVYEHLLKRYELPFEGIRELMAVDWGQAANLYRRQLEQLSAQSQMIHLTARAAIDGGWGVSEAQRLANPELFNNFVPLADVIPDKLRKRFGLDPKEVSDVKVHPIVADLFSAQLDIGTNPNALGILGQLWQDVGTVFRRTVLATTGFVGRQLLNISFQVWASGGDIMEYATMVPRSLNTLLKAHRQGKPIHEFFVSQLDSKRLINGMTEKQIWEEMQRRGLINEIMPWSGEDVGRTYVPSDGLVGNVRRHARYMNNVFQQYSEMSPPRWARSVYEQVTRSTGELTNNAFYAFQLFNAEFENVARFATVKSLMDSSPVGKVRKAFQGNVNRALTLDEALDRMKDYFYFYDDLGRADKAVAKWVVPFWSFVSRNTFAQFRHLLRNPSRFVAYNRLYAAINSPAEDEGDDLPIGAVPDWARGSRPLYWVRENDEGETEYFMLPLRALDPISDGIANVTDIGDSVLRMFGIWDDADFPSVGVQDRLAQLPWESTRTNTAIENLLSNTFPQWKIAYARISGKDVATESNIQEDKTGRQFSSFLGFETTPWVRYTLENAVPLLANINRSNPFGLFGRAPLIDRKTGNVLDPGELSIFGVERSPRDKVNDYRATWQRVAASVGFTFRQLDTAYQMGINEEQIRFSLQEGKRAILKAERDARAIQSVERQREQLERIQYMKLLWTRLMLDHQQFVNWRQSRGYEPQAGVRVLSRQGLSIRQLETLTEQQEFDIIQELYPETID